MPVSVSVFASVSVYGSERECVCISVYVYLCVDFHLRVRVRLRVCLCVCKCIIPITQYPYFLLYAQNKSYTVYIFRKMLMNTLEEISEDICYFYTYK